MKNRAMIFFGSILCAVILLLPTAMRDRFSNMRWLSKPISLGLDLSGGVYLVYRVKTEEAVKGRLMTIGNGAKRELRDQKIAVTKVSVNPAEQLELTLLSARFEKNAEDIISQQYRDVSLIEKVADGEQVKLVYGFTEKQKLQLEEQAVHGALEVLRNRVDQFGVAEPLIQKVGVNRILLQMPGLSDIESVKKAVGSTAKLEFKLVPNLESASSALTLKDRKGIPVKVEEQSLIGGDAVSEARVSAVNGQVEVMLGFTSEGGRTFGRVTAENIGRQLAIVLDGVVYSSPVIREAIRGGSASISGGFTFDEANVLAKVLRSGALPASLEVLEERTVGPSLGKESIVKGIQAILAGFVFIALFMIFYYKKAGAIALGSLVINLLLMLGLLALFGATLTLPGLAGLALTIGMAVDSNVIIFERIRDELKIGATRDAAVRAGFDKAMSAIMDSNLTTLLSGVILYFLGTGPIRGFAVSLSVGILTTIYCATFVCRLGFDFFQLKSTGRELSI